ncbi:hypothetical protein [Salinispora arenicola]|uniref:hypothetical protein n=1 Tax=Salinispora arenicola TaxID=168697 RepID=UPI00035F4BD3|nr:hypothetical protein [Salinispora arenicola]
MVGRSDLQQGVPFTFGFTTARMLASLLRHRERLAELRPRVGGSSSVGPEVLRADSPRSSRPTRSRNLTDPVRYLGSAGIAVDQVPSRG